jgi:cysteine desulfurase
VPAHLDAASGAPLHPVALTAMQAARDDGWADPGRLHGAGRRARLLLDAARESMADSLGARPDEISFTGGGTHALHLAVLGALATARGTPDPRRTVVHSAVEHSAVLRAVQAHQAAGGDAVQVAVDGRARVDPSAMLEAARRPGAAAVALQAANHEVGTVQPLTEVAAGLEGSAVTLVVDATQTIGHAPAPEHWSVLAADARAWAGPAGVGVLAVRTGARWSAPLPADEYEHGRVPGVPDIPQIVGAAAALRAVQATQDAVARRHRALIDQIRAQVAASVPDVEVLGDPLDRLPHLVTFSCLYVDGEELLRLLDAQGFSVSSGASCAASTLQPSHVLAAMGALTSGNVRISLPLDIADEQVEEFVAVLPSAVAQVRAGLGAAGL